MIIFFDGICGLCNRFVNFVMNRDKKKQLRFAPLQGITATKIFGTQKAWDTLRVYDPNLRKSYERSEAVQKIFHQLGGFWGMIGSLMNWIPSALQDRVYNRIVQHRYRLFGKRKTCRQPTPDEQNIFLP